MVVEGSAIIKRLKSVSPEGLEVTTRKGLLTSTYALYFRNSTIYVFRMEDDFSFESHLSYTEDAFLKEFEGVEWRVRMVIG
jgi:hypothetical protein